MALSEGLTSENHFEAANRLAHKGHFEAALQAYDKALALQPTFAAAATLRAQMLRRLGRTAEAIEGLVATSALAPSDWRILSALATLLMEAGQPKAAVTAYDKAVAINPENAVLHANRGLALRMAQRPDEAVVALKAAIRLEPTSKLVTMLSTCELMAGQYPDGWRHYEGRRDPNTRFGRGGFSRPAWTGDENVDGKRVLVHAEQGLGDTIMFSRYLALLRQRGAEVLFAPQRSLRRLMQNLTCEMKLVESEIGEAAFDLHARLLSLPLAFATTVESIPSDVPYITADASRIAAWRARLGAQGVKVGVTWQSSLEGVNAGRSFAPELLTPLKKLPGVRLISLQKPDQHFTVERQRALGVELPDPSFDTEAAFLDTAAIIRSCDLVVACDGSVANLAGALGHSVWIALPSNSDWRWLTDRSDSPWYPTARLFRQPRVNDWTTVMSDIRDALAKYIMPGGPSPFQV